MTRHPAIALATALILIACGADEPSRDSARTPAADRPQSAAPRAVVPPAAPDPPPPAPELPADPVEPSADEEPRFPRYTDLDPLPEGSRPLSSLPDDVRVPEGARPLHPPMHWEEQGITQGTYELDRPAAAVRAALVTNLLRDGWSTDRSTTSGSDALISARKGTRQLTIVTSESEGRTQIVLMEAEAPSP